MFFFYLFVFDALEPIAFHKQSSHLYASNGGSTTVCITYLINRYVFFIIFFLFCLNLMYESSETTFISPHK